MLAPLRGLVEMLAVFHCSFTFCYRISLLPEISSFLFRPATVQCIFTSLVVSVHIAKKQCMKFEYLSDSLTLIVDHVILISNILLNPKILTYENSHAHSILFYNHFRS